MPLHGEYTLWPDDPDKRIVLKNNIPQEGQQTFLKMMVQADNTVVNAGANFYVGLKDATFDPTVGLAAITGEPSATGGYARQAIPRDSGHWPTVTLINGVYRIQSVSVNFTASGADFSTPVSRFFLASVVSGAGKLLSVSAALAAPLLITNGLSVPVQYTLYLA